MGSEGARNTPSQTGISAPVIMRYFSTNPNVPANLRLFLEKTKGVSSLSVDPERQSLRFHFTGEYRHLVAIESRLNQANLPAALVSHAYVALLLSPQTGFTEEGLRASLQGVNGITFLCCANGKYADFYADLASFDWDHLMTALDNAKARGKLCTHEQIAVTLAEADSARWAAQVVGHKGVITLNNPDPLIWVLTTPRGQVKDADLQKLASECGVTIQKIERMSETKKPGKPQK